MLDIRRRIWITTTSRNAHPAPAARPPFDPGDPGTPPSCWPVLKFQISDARSGGTPTLTFSRVLRAAAARPCLVSSVQQPELIVFRLAINEKTAWPTRELHMQTLSIFSVKKASENLGGELVGVGEELFIASPDQKMRWRNL